MENIEKSSQQRCLFCAKTHVDIDLIQMSTNSIFIGEEVFEFDDLLKNLFDSKVCLHFCKFDKTRFPNLLIYSF